MVFQHSVVSVFTVMAVMPFVIVDLIDQVKDASTFYALPKHAHPWISIVTFTSLLGCVSSSVLMRREIMPASLEPEDG